MQKIVLSCKEATFISSVIRYKEIKRMQRMQHKMHLMLCKNCKEFDIQSRLIDQGLDEMNNPSHLADKQLNTQKKSEIRTAVNQHLK